jgi:hypothetical protein
MAMSNIAVLHLKLKKCAVDKSIIYTILFEQTDHADVKNISG